MNAIVLAVSVVLGVVLGVVILGLIAWHVIKGMIDGYGRED